MTTQELIQKKADELYPRFDDSYIDFNVQQSKDHFIKGATFGASLSITKPTKEELLTLAKECIKLPCTDDLKSEEQLYVIHVNHFLKNHTASLNGWVSVKDRLPTKEDGNEEGEVLCYDELVGLIVYKVEYPLPNGTTHWRKIVKP